MKYFFDTEFHEYKKKPFLQKPIDTIELISIGIVAEDGREYYAICNEFDVKAAWNNEWLRENVLLPIYTEFITDYTRNRTGFSLSGMKRAIALCGKSRTTIANQIKEFTFQSAFEVATCYEKERIEFYAYYADYDWVVFCWLFGRMIDLPKGFPKYCKDLKQISDEVYEEKKASYYGFHKQEAEKHTGVFLNEMSDHPDYPIVYHEHNALADAEWNVALYKFLIKISK